MEVEILPSIDSPDKLSQSLSLPTKNILTQGDQKRLDLISKLEERSHALTAAGLGRGLLFQTIVDGLKATKDIYSSTGKIVASEPDHNVRAKFVAVAVEVLGEKAREEGGVRIGMINIRLPDGTRL